MEIKFVKESLPDLEYWRKSGNKRTLNKITQLLKAIKSDYKKGLDQPEQLKNNLSDCWSRRINKKDRIVYTVSEEDGVIYIMSLRGHYGDK